MADCLEIVASCDGVRPLCNFFRGRRMQNGFLRKYEQASSELNFSHLVIDLF